MSRYGRKRISRRDVLKAAGALAASVAALGGGAWLLQRMDDEQDRANASDSYTTNDHRTAAELKEITYKGKNYRQRPDLESYLFLGIDVMGPAVGTQSYVAGGQADTQILLVLDIAAKTWQLLQINRDSMVEVPVLSMMGTVAYTIKQQIALAHAYGNGREQSCDLAHAYGNGREQSCENNVLAVSMLLDDQPIDGYFSLSGLSYAANGQLNNLYNQVTNAESTEQLLETTAPAAAATFETTVGAPASEYTPIALYDVAASASAEAVIAESGSVQVAISVPDVADGTQVVAICWDRNGNSRTVPVRVVNGVVYLTVYSSGPVMIMARTQVQG